MTSVIDRDGVRLSPEDYQLISSWLEQHPDRLLLIPEIRQHLSQQSMAEANKNQAVATIEGGRAGTLKHNLAAVERGMSMERGSQIFYSVMSDTFVLKNRPHVKILIIGPREESEIFALIGQQFDPKNIAGLDLISYSPFVTLGDMHEMPFEDNSFDIVVSSFCLNYSDDATRACREITRVLRDSGIAIIGAEQLSIHENIDYWATPNKQHWLVPSHLESLFGDNFGESIFRCTPTPVPGDGYNRRIVTAFRTKKGKIYNRVIDSFFDELAVVVHAKTLLASTAKESGIGEDALAVLNARLDAHQRFLLNRHMDDQAAQSIATARNIVGEWLDWVTSHCLHEVFRPTASKFMTLCDIKPQPLFTAGDAETVGKEIQEEGFHVLADTLAPDVLQSVGSASGWQDSAWRQLILDPWLVCASEAHLGCTPVVIGPGTATAADQFDFLPDHPRSLRLFVFLADSHGMAYVRRSHRDRPIDYFARRGWTDEEVVTAYGADKLVPISGKAGTIVLADGGGLMRTCRDAAAVLEIRLANTAFGADPARFSLDVIETPYEKLLVQHFPRLFQGAFL